MHHFGIKRVFLSGPSPSTTTDDNDHDHEDVNDDRQPSLKKRPKKYHVDPSHKRYYSATTLFPCLPFTLLTRNETVSKPSPKFTHRRGPARHVGHPPQSFAFSYSSRSLPFSKPRISLKHSIQRVFIRTLFRQMASTDSPSHPRSYRAPPHFEIK